MKLSINDFMNNPKSVLAVFAHPDDESLAAGGTLAGLAHEGARTALLCATRGEWGPISDESLADYETLGAVREQELRQACEVLGIGWLRFLDLPDGSVRWAMADEEYQALEKVVRAIRELQPELVITFGPDGFYGHEDHIAIGQLTTEACQLAGDPTVFPAQIEAGLRAHQPAQLCYAVCPQGLLQWVLEKVQTINPAANFWGIPPAQFGVPLAQIDWGVDVRAFLPQRWKALRCHRTQLDADNAFALLHAAQAEAYFSHEYFQEVALSDFK